MGNCQAIDNASIVVQHLNGKVERLYSPVSAAHIMKLNPGHYVALLLTTTFISSSAAAATATTTNSQPLRITRIKLLRPTDTLALGHAYRIITSQEVMKGLRAKKNGKLNNKNISNKIQPLESAGKDGGISDCEAAAVRTHQQVNKSDEHRRRTAAPANSSAKPKGWHPSLKSISEATS